MQMRLTSTQPRLKASARSGLTLYEVALSIAIFLMAMAAIGQLISGGSRSSVDASLRTEAAIQCETKMNEVLAGALNLEPVNEQALSEDDASWKWSLSIADGEIEGIKDLTVTVSHYTNNGQINATYSLRRLVRDPQLFEDAALEAAAEAEEEETTSSGN